MAKHTRDEAYYWSSISKEERMKRGRHVLRTQLSSEIKVGEPKLLSKDELEVIKEIPEEEIEIEEQMDVVDEIPGPMSVSNDKPKTKEQKKAQKPQTVQTPKKGQAKLFEFQGKERKTTIIADTREFNSDVVRELSRKGIVVNSQQLDVGDYVLSDRLAVERKESNDFLKSLMDGRLFSQLKLLKSAYINPILILEGEDILGRGISDAAIYGALASIISDFKIPIIQTSDMKETANLLAVMAKREISEKRQIGIRGDKVSMSLQERQQFIIEGLPGVSATLAQRLLDHFGSVEAVISASEKELCEVKGIGDTIAKSIVEVIKSGYLKK
jgi:Fanconi anemia group M protein